MTAYQTEFDQAVRFYEDLVHDLKTLLRTTPAAEFAGMGETLAAYRAACITALGIYLAAEEIAGVTN